MKNNVQKIIRSFYAAGIKEGTNEIEYDESSSLNKIAVFDSELLRIVEAADAKNVVKKKRKNIQGQEKEQIYIPGLISLKIGWSVPSYQEAMKKYGGKLILKHVKRVNINKGKTDANGKKLPRIYEYQPVKDRQGVQRQEVFVRLIVGSSQGRAKKALYIREDLYEDVNKVLLGGMDAPELAKINGFPAFSGGYAKWNAYYGLASTDSLAMEYVPRIVVVRDFEREVTDMFDVLKPSEEPIFRIIKDGKAHLLGASVEYRPENHVERTIAIKPFDGAGLVSVECAKKWAQQLGLDLESQLPAAFQIRAIPGIKGNLYTFDIEKFGGRYGGKIRDVLYDPEDPDRARHEHDPREVDVILTESQVKFLKMYGKDLDLWREQFEKPVLFKNGESYQRTFNISEYSPGASELKGTARTTYQHWQTIHNTEKENEHVSYRTLKQLESISMDVEAFLRYRCYVEEGEDPEDLEWGRILPYYKTAYKMSPENRRILFTDPYFQKKVEKDIEGACRRALMGKLAITGNYQYLTPDIFALAQHSFGMEVEGLLSKEMIYSKWWITQDEEAQNQAYQEAYEQNREPNPELLGRYDCKELALIRNPHIYMEARIARMASGENMGWERYGEMEDWYQYQTTGIITDSYSTIPLALGTADFDGDTILTTNCHEYLVGVRRALQDKKGNTLLLERDEPLVPVAENVTDVSKLLETDFITYRIDIARVVDKVTNLWGYPYNMLKNLVYENRPDTVRDLIKAMAIVGQLTLDAAKTGEVPEIPQRIRAFCRQSKVGRPWFMRYKSKKNKIPREASQLKALRKNANNMDQFCNLAEKKIVAIQEKKQKPQFAFSTEQFLQFFLVGGKPAEDTPLYREAEEKLKELAEKNNRLFQYLASENKEDRTPHYRYLYGYAKEEFLQIAEKQQASEEELLDCLIYLTYTDENLLANDGAKNVLWNAFENEMVGRAERNTFAEANFAGLDTRMSEIRERMKEAEKEKRKEQEAKPLHISTLEDKRKKYHRIEIRQNDLDLILEKIPQMPEGSSKRKRKKDDQLRRLYAVYMIIQKYCGKIEIKTNNNNSLNWKNLERLCGMTNQRKWLYDKTKELLELEAVSKIDDSAENTVKIKVACSPSGEGDPLIDTDDYRQACEEILKLVAEPGEDQEDITP